MLAEMARFRLTEDAVAPRIVLTLKVQVSLHSEDDRVAQGDL